MPIYRNLWQVLKERGRSPRRESASNVGDLDPLSSRRSCIAPEKMWRGSVLGTLDVGKYAGFAFLDGDLREEPTGLLNGYGCSHASFTRRVGGVAAALGRVILVRDLCSRRYSPRRQ